MPNSIFNQQPTNQPMINPQQMQIINNLLASKNMSAEQMVRQILANKGVNADEWLKSQGIIK